MRYFFLSLSFCCCLHALNAQNSLSPIWKQNLVDNGNAETRTEKKIIPGWKADTSQVQVRAYDAAALKADTSKYTNEGSSYFRFAGNNDSTTRTLRQEIDLREAVDSIAKGTVTFFLTGDLGGRDTIPGVVFVLLTFQDSKGSTVASFNTLPVKRDERHGKTGLIHREVRSTVPVNAVKAVVQLKAYLDGQCAPKQPCAWEAYADNISFMLLPFAFDANNIGTKQPSSGAKQ